MKSLLTYTTEMSSNLYCNEDIKASQKEKEVNKSSCYGNRASSLPETTERGNSPAFRSRASSPSSENMIARSRAEQNQFDIAESGINNGGSKFRQLPCRTFIATGYCPYKDRCVYLHCPSIRSPFEVRLFCSLLA